MNDSSESRAVHLRADVDRSSGENRETRCSGLRGRPQVDWITHRDLFNHHHNRLAQIVRGYSREGIAVFALHAEKGIAGHLWLELSDELRAGTIGRHSGVDLFLRDEESLSLRHLAVLARRDGPNRFRVRVLDLATPLGFNTEMGTPLRMLEADGTVVFHAAGYSFFLLPTGRFLPWNVHSADPWFSLPRRTMHELASVPASAALRRARPDGNTRVTTGLGPLELGTEALLVPGEPEAGQLTLVNDSIERVFSIGAHALTRGVILGRYERCVGAGAGAGDRVSRVHAVVCAIDNVTYFVDTGSTNGTYIGDLEVKCARVVPGVTFSLGSMQVVWRPAAKTVVPQ